MTLKIGERYYVQLLKKTHERITKHLVQENWKDKLVPYSGPQCNEDRLIKEDCQRYREHLDQLQDRVTQADSMIGNAEEKRFQPPDTPDLQKASRGGWK